MKKITPLLFAAALLTACDIVQPIGDISCNAMYSPDQVHIDFDAFEFEEGDYSIVFTSDETVICDVSLPADADEYIDCDGEPEVMVTLSNDGSRIDEMALWEYAPDAFEVEILLDGELVDEARFEPAYEVDEPNGEGCGERSYAAVSF